MSANAAAMAGEKFTRCPGCKTIFRVTPPQLEMRGGQVRCGHCRTAFDGVAALVSLEPRIVERTAPSFEEMDLGPPTMTLRSSRALEAVAPAEVNAPSPGAAEAPAPFEAPAPLEAPASLKAPASLEADARAASDAEGSNDDPLAPSTPADAADSGPGPGEADYASRFSDRETRQQRRVPGWLFAAAIPLLLIVLASQAIFHYRDAVAGRWPALKPVLMRACTALGCTIRPLQDNNGLSIEASDLQSDPAHRGLLILTATLRNRAAASLAYPHLELTLTDTREQVVVRRAFSPQEYAGGTADLATGIAGNAEVGIKLFIDASATTQAGYQVYLFYP